MRTRSSRPALLALSLGYFALGTASLAVVGLSAPISRDLQVRPATVGTLVTVFAVVFALAAPAATILLGRMCRKRALLLGLGLLVLGGAGAAVAPDYPTLCAARVLAGLGAAVFGPAASAAGSAIVPAEQRTRALATVFAGMTAASVLGVPVASSAGDALGWRGMMLSVAALTAVAFVLVARLLPVVEPEPAPTARSFADTLRAPGAVPMLGTTFMIMTAQFTVYGVAGAYLTARFGAAQGTVALVLFGFGALGTLGNVLGSRVYARFGGVGTVSLALGCFAAGFAGLTGIPGSLLLALPPLAVWAFASGLFMAPQQARLVELLPERRGILLALNASGLYLGMSLGSLAGSALLPGLGARPLSALALLPLALATAAHLASARRNRPVHTIPQSPTLTHH
ncbi:MFS transporter [Actinomadura harenae]|uniref:MFS transporter n=1 Tax=Actinomadura harenae TaxID=2483351 RepID=A0A3M2LKX3_9ACTN|nr:MFS transporter [Actinomadura harenae]RMI36705.1 MFS transporter [Actinomadura harenae]